MDLSASFENRHVVVTGGTGALGSAVVALLVERGATCHVPSHGADVPAHFTLRDHPSVKIVSNVDLTDEASVDAFYGAIPSLWASIHAAGGFAAAPVAETGKNALLAQIETNFVTSALCCRAAIAGMRRSGGGRIVNVVSRQALEWRLGAGMTAYAASKAALAAFTAGLAQEVASDGILVNAVAPSTIDTPANRSAMPKADFASWPKPAEIASTIAFLASPGNAVTRGATVPVYGKS
jgi:NAD(P)-dependent dehydrogenase (short-subunit alcohol dehydrogenase family)